MNTSKTQLYYFLDRLNDYDTIDLIRVINEAKGYSEPEDLCSDPYEDMDIRVDSTYFYVEENSWPLAEMKESLYQNLFSLNRKAKEYIEEIENTDVYSFRSSHLLKFKVDRNEKGKVYYRCESLCKINFRLTFIRYCNKDDCKRMLHDLKVAKQVRNLKLDLFSSVEHDVILGIDKNWFTLKKLTEPNYSGIGIQAGEQLVKEWYEFLETN
ncbi:MAG: hypothetical protein N4A46_05750 [Schleiferiaceae bacterium]|nr:hypothetical protein [Schleiferiaceae bacterium]